MIAASFVLCVPRATILGTTAAAVVYLLSLITVFGLVPNAELRNASAPFANATTNLTGASWAGGAVALVVVISGCAQRLDNAFG